MTLLARVHAVLVGAGVPHALIGGAALVLFGACVEVPEEPAPELQDDACVDFNLFEDAFVSSVGYWRAVGVNEWQIDFLVRFDWYEGSGEIDVRAVRAELAAVESVEYDDAFTLTVVLTPEFGVPGHDIEADSGCEDTIQTMYWLLETTEEPVDDAWISVVGLN